MVHRLQQTPPSPERPWRLVLYADEVVPGDGFKGNNLRKVWVIYFSWLELGLMQLSNEDAWFCECAQRTYDVAKWSGGISQLMAVVIKRFYGSIAECNLAVGGMVL